MKAITKSLTVLLVIATAVVWLTVLIGSVRQEELQRVYMLDNTGQVVEIYKCETPLGGK
jgi:hypothetical protein